MSRRLLTRGLVALLLVALAYGLVRHLTRDEAAAHCGGPAPDAEVWQARPDSRELVLMLHAFTRSPGSLCQVRAALAEQGGQPAADVWIPSLPFGTFSQVPMDRVVEQLNAGLAQRWRERAQQGKPYERVRIVGHSLGSLAARQLYLSGLGAEGQTPQDWALNTERLVLLAGISRGWRIDHHMEPLNAIWYEAGEGLDSLVRLLRGPTFTVMHGRHGSAFVNRMRLQWQQLPARWAQLRAAGLAPREPLVVQLLGTVDDIVPPSSNIDPATSTNFVFLSVPRSGHTNVVQLQHDAKDAGAPALRAAVFAQAWGDRPQAATPAGDRPLAVRQARVEPQVRHVVFVMHGIRDEGHWTERVASHVEQALCAAEGCIPGADSGVVFEISSYGYFPMLSFLRPSSRQDKVAWLFDRYAEARARYPNAHFHYVGHSHGTYLLKEALEQLPEVRFDRVVLAGSVLRRSEDWAGFLAKGQVKQVLNLRAHADWVVAVFPSTMEHLSWQDLGGAGHDGFAQQVPGLFNGPLHEHREGYVRGNHGSGVGEHAWQTIAHFVAQGEPSYEGLATEPEHRSFEAWAGSWGGVVLWVALLGVLLWVAWAIHRFIRREWLRTLAYVGYGLLIWTVITRV